MDERIRDEDSLSQRMIRHGTSTPFWEFYDATMRERLSSLLEDLVNRNEGQATVPLEDGTVVVLESADVIRGRIRELRELLATPKNWLEQSEVISHARS